MHANHLTAVDSSVGTTFHVPVSIRRMKRPLAVTLVSLYYAGFSGVLVGLLVWQVASGKVHSRWSDAAFPLAFALMLAIIPGVIALGLWVMDNAARFAAILVAIVHGIATLHWAAHPLFGWQWLPPLRIAIDVAIIVALSQPSMRRAFRENRIVLGLER